MKKFLIAASALALLSGTAFAGSDTTHAGASVQTGVHVKKHKHHAATTDGYSVGVPTRDPGRYSNLPDKDGLNSKAVIQDH